MNKDILTFIQHTKKAKEERIKFLTYDSDGNFCKTAYKRFQKRKIPWYILTSGKCFIYIPKLNVNNHKDYIKRRTCSEQGIFCKKYLSKKTSLFENRQQIFYYKIEKWIKRNPKPCSKDDLFAEHFLKEWEDKQDDVSVHIKRNIKSKQNTLQLYGIFGDPNNPVLLGYVYYNNGEIDKKKHPHLIISERIREEAATFLDLETTKDNASVAGFLVDPFTKKIAWAQSRFKLFQNKFEFNKTLNILNSNFQKEDYKVYTKNGEPYKIIIKCTRNNNYVKLGYMFSIPYDKKEEIYIVESYDMFGE